MTHLLPILALLAISLPASSWAIPTPVRPLAALIPGLPELLLKVDVRNLVGADGAGKIPEAAMRSRIEFVNNVWAQCAVRFVVRETVNVNARDLGIPYEPKSQADLSRIASALNPNGFHEALPVTFAGPWNFYDAGSGLYIYGLGWVFMKEHGIDRIGAMIANQKIFIDLAGPIIAHELAHALSLPHTAEAQNLMGRAGTSDLTPAQCRQARLFAQTALSEFLVESSAPLAIR